MIEEEMSLIRFTFYAAVYHMINGEGEWTKYKIMWSPVSLLQVN